ncbi:transposase [Nocardia sp. NPDC049220]
MEAAGRRLWCELPERYGPWRTAYERLRMWTGDGTWQRISWTR